MNPKLLAAACAALLVFSACDDGNDDSSTARPTSDSAEHTPTQAPPESHAISVDTSFGADGFRAAPLSEDSDDRFMAVAFAPGGTFYATGFVAEDGDNAMALARFDEEGAPDESFGDVGKTVVNVASGGKTAEVSRAVVVQDDGKVLIGGPVEHDPSATGDAARDTDIALVRVNQDGTLDAGFGDEGVAIFDLGAGRQVAAGTFIGDNSWGIGTLPGGRAVVFASTLARGEGRMDSDLVLFAVTASGELDASFGEGGKVVVDINNASINPRTVLVQDDGMIVATGYGDIGGVVQPVAVRVDSAGVLDDGFGEGGVATARVLPGVGESYAIARQGDSYILAGYGRGADSTEKVDLIVYRWSSDGRPDPSFGDNGVTRIDLAGQDDRARNLLVLPGGEIIAVGSGKLTESEVDAMVVLLDQDGAPLETFGDGGHALLDLGGPSDAFFGVAAAPDGRGVIVAGYKGADPEGDDNDDAVLFRLALD